MELRRVSGGYRGAEVVKNVTLNFAKGRVTVLVGPNGSGKSTVIKISAGLLPAYSGEVLLEGRPLDSYTRNEIARRVSYLPQIRNVPNISVGAIVMHGRFPYLSYPRRYRKEDIEAAENAMRYVGIADLAGRGMAEISGGERQKAYIAMLMAQNSGIVFMDEPTTYLDISHQLEITELSRKLADDGKTVVMVLHDLNMALKHADFMAVMNNGEINAYGTPNEILNAGVISDVFGVKVLAAHSGEAERVYSFIKM